MIGDEHPLLGEVEERGGERRRGLKIIEWTPLSGSLPARASRGGRDEV